MNEETIVLANVSWGDIQVEALAKMFLNKLPFTVADLPAFRTNKTYSPYLARMPFVANEGLNIILSRGVGLVKRLTLTEKEQVDISGVNQKLYCFDLQKTTANFKAIEGVQVNGLPYNNYMIKLNKYLYLDKSIYTDNVVEVIYRTYVTPITSETPDDTILDIPYEVATILPTYMASELYKDDDLALSTVYRNQFEVELDALRNPDDDTSITDVCGWL